jgi:Histone acetyltransferase subunit NuA4
MTSEADKKRDRVERQLLALEKQIYALETSYLEDTNSMGNLLRGWEGYLSRSGTLPPHRRKPTDADRLFSLSSVSSGVVTEAPGDARHDQQYVQQRQPAHSQLATLSNTSSASTSSSASVRKGPGRPRKKSSDDSAPPLHFSEANKRQRR